MFRDVVKFAAVWIVSLALLLAAATSIIVCFVKQTLTGESFPNPIYRVGRLVGERTGLWNLYPDSTSMSDSLFSGIGISSLIIFIVAVTVGWWSAQRFLEIKETARTLRMEKLKNKYR